MKRIGGIPISFIEQARRLENRGGDPDLMLWTDPGGIITAMGLKIFATWRNYGYTDYADFKKANENE